MKLHKYLGAELPNDYKICSVIRTNDILEVKVLEKSSDNLSHFKKISKTEYLDMNTGEIKKYEESKSRRDNIISLKRTFKNLRNLINNNFVGASNELFLTLTYAENMTDVKRLYSDFDIFMKRFKRRYSNIDYINAVEPQGRGAWHCHVLIRFNDLKKIYIPNDDIAKLWGHGFTSTKSLKGIDNIGAYLTAYLTDIELTPETAQSNSKIVTKEIIDDNTGIKSEKKFIKGGRCHMYPVGMNIFRHSRGIKPPYIVKVPFSEIKKEIGSRTPDFSSTYEILDDNGKHLNTVSYLNFNLKRNKNQGV